MTSLQRATPGLCDNINMLAVCAQKQGVQVKSVVKDSHWYDVGIVKVTNMVVSHYYVPYDAGMIDVSASTFFFFQSQLY